MRAGLPATVTALFKRRRQFRGVKEVIALEPANRLNSDLLFAGKPAPTISRTPIMRFDFFQEKQNEI